MEARKCLRTWNEFNDEFVKVDLQTLNLIIRAADYLDIESLVDLTCQGVADSIKGKSIREMRRILGIKNDFSLEEEEKLMRKLGRLMGVPPIFL